VELNLSGTLKKKEQMFENMMALTSKEPVRYFSILLSYRGKTEEQDESRGVAIGADFDLKILFVVHLIVEDDYIRIISARKADTKERKIYEN
jgi:uncharacterized DUF497 family protein